MEFFNWFKNKEVKDEVSAISDKAFSRLSKRTEGSSLSSLSEDEKTYIKERFTKTDEDTLQDDYAKEMLIKSADDIDQIEKTDREAYKTEKAVSSELLKRDNELDEKEWLIESIEELLRYTKFLRSSIDTYVHPDPSKSLISTDQTKQRVLEEINEYDEQIKSLLETSKEESLEDLMDNYDTLLDRFGVLQETWENEKFKDN